MKKETGRNTKPSRLFNHNFRQTAKHFYLKSLRGRRQWDWNVSNATTEHFRYARTNHVKNTKSEVALATCKVGVISA